MQSDQSVCELLEYSEQHFEFLSLRGGCTGLSESTLAKLPHCWKSHIEAYIVGTKRALSEMVL